MLQPLDTQYIKTKDTAYERFGCAEVSMSATQLKNGLRAWHEELLEYTLANPRASLQEAALFFNVTVSWLSIVKNSDAFKEMWAKRRPEHFSRISAGVSERITALAEVSLDALTNRIEKDVREGNATVATLRESADLALKAMGFGNKGNTSPLVQTNVQNTTNVFVDRDTLARAREAKAKLQKTIEGELAAARVEGFVEVSTSIEDQTREINPNDNEG